MNRPTKLIVALLAAAGLSRGAAATAQVNLRDTVTVQVVKKAHAAVVSITAQRLVTQRVSPFPGDPFWQQFNVGPLVRVPADFLGSGIIIQKTGYIVTNNHVISGARSIHVKLSDGRTLPARLVSTDPRADLAILKVSGKKPFPTLTLGDSSGLMIGEPAIAVGNPFGFNESVSSGIVSAVHRNLDQAADNSALHHLIQTDAAINPGNSGGPLLNAYAQVIGINTAIRGGAQNIGFAIGVNRLRRLMPRLMDPALVNGVVIPLHLRERCTITPPAKLHRTLFAVGVVSPVVAIDHRPVHTIAGACALLLRVRPAQHSVLVKFANGTRRFYPVSKLPYPRVVLELHRLAGMRVQQVTPQLAKRQHLPISGGLLVTEIDHASPAAKAGLQPGDILVQLGGFRVYTLAALKRALAHVRQIGPLRIVVARGHHLAVGTINL